MASLQAFNLKSVRSTHIEDGISAAPFYRRFSSAAQHVIRSIHAIVTLFKDVVLGEVEVYLGRAGGTPEHVLARFREHRTVRGHEYGVVLFVGDTDDVIGWEGTCNRLLKRLETGGHLCVANVYAGENGPAPSTPESVVYMTWRFVRRKSVTKPTPRQIEDIAVDVAESRSEERSADQLMTAMAPLVRPSTDFADMRWHPDHDSD